MTCPGLCGSSTECSPAGLSSGSSTGGNGTQTTCKYSQNTTESIPWLCYQAGIQRGLIAIEHLLCSSTTNPPLWAGTGQEPGSWNTPGAQESPPAHGHSSNKPQLTAERGTAPINPLIAADRPLPEPGERSSSLPSQGSLINACLWALLGPGSQEQTLPTSQQCSRKRGPAPARGSETVGEKQNGFGEGGGGIPKLSQVRAGVSPAPCWVCATPNTNSSMQLIQTYFTLFQGKM